MHELVNGQAMVDTITLVVRSDLDYARSRRNPL